MCCLHSQVVFHHIWELFWCHINLSRSFLRCAVLARLSGGAAALGCLVTGSVAVLVLRGAWQGNRLWPYSHPAPLVQVSSWRTTPVRATSEIYHCAPASEIRTSQHYVWTFWSSLGLPCDLVSSPGEGERCDQARMDKPACDQTILQHPCCWGCSEKPGQ